MVSEVSDWYAVKLANNQIGFIQKNESKPVVVNDKNTLPATLLNPLKHRLLLPHKTHPEPIPQKFRIPPQIKGV